MTDLIPHVIDGQEVEASDSATFANTNPWIRRPCAEVALAGPTDVTRAVTAARRAFDDGPWPRMGVSERAKVLHRMAEAIEEQAEQFARADTTDMGKPLRAMYEKDVPRSAANLRFFAEYARLSSGESFQLDSGHHAYSWFEPAGVVAAITPWNFPLMLGTERIAPALAWGNTVVLKPAPDTPTSATLLAKLALEAGMPPGVLNVVHGFGEPTGTALVESSQVDRVAFTGSATTGRFVAEKAARNLTPVSLEMGAKNPTLVFADADLEATVDWAAKAAFSNTGQTCLAGSRLYVERPLYEEFLARFTEAANGLAAGDPMDMATDIGPLASESHFNKVISYIDNIPQDGGKLLTGGLEDGWLIRPIVVVGLSHDAPACREEIFGPVVTVLPFDDETEGIRLANDSTYGLNGMVFTQNLSRAHRVSRALEVGMVWVNCYAIRDLRLPFGGRKSSGVGREGGAHSREFFTEPKATVMEV